MIVEELVARLGFETKGLGDLKKFDKALEGAKKNLDAFGKAANKTVGNPLNPMSRMGRDAAANAKQLTGLQKVMAAVKGAFMAFTLGAVKVGAILLRTTAIIGSLAMRFSGLAAGIAGVTLVLFRMAAAAALAAAKTAKLRREAQLAAKGSGTTAANRDKLTKGLAAIGVSNDDSKSFADNIATKANEAITGNDYSAFKKAGAAVLDKDGRQIDTSAASTNILLRYLDLVKKGRDARAKSDAATGKGKEAAKAKANAAELKAREFAGEWEISGAMKGALDDLKGGAAEFLARMKEANERNPAPTAEQESRSKKIAEEAQRLEQSVEALDQIFTNVKESILSKVIGPLADFGDGLVRVAKALGWISETLGEREARAESDREARRGKGFNKIEDSKTRAALDAAASSESGSWLGALFGSEVDKARAGLKRAAEGYALAKTNRDSPLKPHDEAGIAFWNKRVAETAAELAAAFDRLKAASKDGSKPMSAAPGFRSEAAEDAKGSRLHELNASIIRLNETLSGGAKGMADDANAKIENDNRKYENIGNDQRTISPTVNINQTVTGMEGAAAAAGAAAKNGVLGAISTKGANTSTGALTTP